MRTRVVLSEFSCEFQRRKKNVQRFDNRKTPLAYYNIRIITRARDTKYFSITYTVIYSYRFVSDGSYLPVYV